MRALPPAPALGELQSWLVAVTTDTAGVSAGIQRAGRLHPVGASELSDVERVVTPGPKLSALQRLAIYNDGYFARLVECLADDYPALRYALGDAEFERVARASIAARPSRSPSLNAYGSGMPAFLRALTADWAPFVAELSELEWSLVTAIHAESAPALAPDALARIRPEDWSRVRLSPSPSLALHDFAYPVDAFYQAFRDDGEPDWPSAEPSAVAVHRSGFSVYRLDLDPASRCLLGDLVNGVTLGAALAHLERQLTASELASAHGKLGAWFRDWIASGLFMALELD
jgi:hypothetical protein